MSENNLTSKQQREKIKSLLGKHIIDALDTDREITAEEKRKRPSASMINAAISWLKCTDPDLGPPTKEEVEERRKEMEQRYATYVPRIAVDELAPLPDYTEDQPYTPRVPVDGFEEDVQP